MKTPLKNILKKFLDHFEEFEIQESLYEEEFQNLKHITNSLKGNPDYSCESGQKDVNRPKNRYKDIVPYDSCRVALPELISIPGTDYVNASYVKGASGALAYIAAQGPLPNTVRDFWRMIWVCEVQVIIMACNEREGGKTKCEPYWTEVGEQKQFGQISVEFVSQSQVCSDFLVRTLLVKQGDETRDIWQFHYTTWPDHSVPDTVQPILDMVRYVRDCQASETAPILVHCSAGCGRTGTICAIDFIWALLRTGKLTEDFCLYDIVAEMRKQRIAMVQTKEQYMLVYKAVATMFQQQLHIIDSHTYENLDQDGIPITWKGQADLFQHIQNDVNELANVELRSSFKLDSEGELRTDKTVSSEKSLRLSNGFDHCSDANLKRDSENNVICENLDNKTQFPVHTQSVKKNPVPLAVMDSPLNVTTEGDSIKGLSTSDSDSSDIFLVDNVVIRSERKIDKALISGLSSESIPFIDDDDTKSEICVRPRCGRAYLHIPSYDSFSKFIDRFDPFVDVVSVDSKHLDNETTFSDGTNLFSKISTIGQQVMPSSRTSKTGSMISTNTMPFEVSDMEVKDVHMCSDQNEISILKPECVQTIDSDKVIEETKDIVQSRGKSKTLSCSSSASESSGDKCLKNSEKSMPRRSSLTRFGLRTLFERSGKSKSEGKSSLFRNHSHHVSRAGSAPPSLNSMSRTNDVEKESLFGLVSKKFRSSSVKSEHELRKEAATTNQFLSLKKTAVNSFTHLKQNFSNFSRNVTLNFNKYSNRQAPVPENLPEISVKNKNAEVFSKNTYSKSMWYDKTSPSNTGLQKHKSPVLHRRFESNMETINQKFVVNVLSSGRNEILIGKPENNDKPGSPKSKTFLIDKNKPKLLPFTSVNSNKSSKKDPSTLWYHQENQEMTAENQSVEDFKSSLSSRSNFFLKESAADSVETPTTVEHSSQINNSIGAKSVFYTTFMAENDKPLLPLKKKDGNDIDNSMSKSLSQDDPKIKDEDGGFENSQSFWPSNSIVAVEKQENIAVQSKSVDEGKNPVNELTSNSSVPKNISECSRDQNSGGSESTSNCEKLVCQTSEKIEAVQPPALPKKTVIGRNRNLMIQAFGDVNSESKKIEIKNSDQKVEPSIASASGSQLDNIQGKEALPEIDPQTIVFDSASSNTLYSNVNIIAKKNLEQIENTLRNHPRGAIIDLTSRNSYSLDEELASAVKKLPDPLKSSKKLTASQLAKLKNAGYEVIWPTGEDQSCVVPSDDVKVRSSKNLFDSKPQNLEKEKISISASGNSSSKKGPQQIKSGFCYSPPLRRSALANYPVLKSQSCATLDWLEPERDELMYRKIGADVKSDSAETLVNEAVVELSTMLDELTTKTLTDDLNLTQGSEQMSENTAISKNGQSNQNNSENAQPDLECVPLVTKEDKAPDVPERIDSLDQIKSPVAPGKSDLSTEDNPPVVPGRVYSVDRNKPPIVSEKSNSGAEDKPPDIPEKLDAIAQDKPPTPHVYETVFLPTAAPPRQKVADDIVFHFPPPPSVPPPPPKYFEVESFDIVCKDGMLRVRGSIDESAHAAMTPESNEGLTFSSETDLAPPVPIPRKKQNVQSAGNLRKSASYTTLVPQLPPNNQMNSLVIERCQTLPRLLVDESAYIFESSLQESTSEIFPIENKTSLQNLNKPLSKIKSDYETIFPSSNSSLIQQPVENSGSSVHPFSLNYQENALQNVNTKLSSTYKEDKIFKDGMRESLSLKSYQIEEKTKVGQKLTAVGESGDLIKTTKKQSLSGGNSSSSVYGKINKVQQHQHKLTSADVHEVRDNTFDTNESSDVQKHEKKKVLLPSRKAEHAPPPPSLRNPPVAISERSVGVMTNSCESSEKVSRRFTSRKHERAPPPPLIKRSASTKEFSRNLDQGKSHSKPTYSVVQKQKLHALLENISDSQVIVNPSVANSSSDEQQTDRKGLKKLSSGCSLQHSQSDASVFKELRGKFMSKKKQTEKMSETSSAKTTSDSSGTDSSEDPKKLPLKFTTNFSDEEKLQRAVTKQKVSVPVAPPRSRRRSTIEIDFCKPKATAGASCCVAVSPLTQMTPVSPDEPTPAVPVKTKEAFQIPEEYLHNGVRNQVQSNEKPKASGHHSTNKKG